MADTLTPAPDVIGPPRPLRFNAAYKPSVRAMQFDGSRESAAAIAALFPNRVFWSVEREGVLLARVEQWLSFEPLNELAPGSWLVEVDRYIDAWALMKDADFRFAYAPALYQDPPR